MRSKALLLPVAVACLMAGCSGGDPDTSASEPTSTPSVSPTASPTPSPTPSPTGDPLTGLAPGRGPVVAIKVDNAFLARPYQRGLKQASIVYQELVEGGLTRFMAVFESGTATSEVGPVRSARESDVDILRAYGGAALGFSGAQPGVFAIVRAAARSGKLVDASRDSAPGLYRGGERRRDARNFFVVPSRLGKARGGAALRDIGLRFGAVGKGLPTATARAAFSPGSVIKVRYNASTGRYVLSQGGRVIPFSPANVVVQYVATHPSRFHDVHGMNTPLTVSTGSGRSYVMRDGVRMAATWKRTGFGATHFRDGAGRDVLLKPGPTWIFLLPKGQSISFG
ncbi:MAG TPA: DUF3048 domain-containing protein [Mycobacteriales bacterium]|nr:DUF3048 domain-containing protein [Mycobacteriales bacterium]